MASDRTRVIGLVVAFSLPGVLLARWLPERAAEPGEAPGLVIAREDAARSLAALTADALRISEDEAVAAHDAAQRELSAAEVRGIGSPVEAEHVQSAVLTALAAAAPDESARGSLRARDTLALVDSLDDVTLTPDETAARFGDFLGHALRYRALAAEEGEAPRRVAPRIVFVALAMARWNAMNDRPLTEGFDDTLLRAYHGWLAFAATDGATELRQGALAEYRRAGGARSLELEGAMFASAGDRQSARAAYERAYRATGSLRLRNYALAMTVEAGGADELDDEP